MMPEQAWSRLSRRFYGFAARTSPESSACPSRLKRSGVKRMRLLLPSLCSRRHRARHGNRRRTHGDAARHRRTRTCRSRLRDTRNNRTCRPPGGRNAIYRAIDDISLLRGFRFGNESELSVISGSPVTMIEAGRQHTKCPTNAAGLRTYAPPTPTRMKRPSGYCRRL